jgi:hypothetical protein
MKDRFSYQTPAMTRRTGIATLTGSPKEQEWKAERLLQLLPARFLEQIRGAYYAEAVEGKGVLSTNLLSVEI